MATLIACIMALVATALFLVCFAQTRSLDALAMTLLAAAFTVIWFVAYHPL